MAASIRSQNNFSHIQLVCLARKDDPGGQGGARAAQLSVISSSRQLTFGWIVILLILIFIPVGSNETAIILLRSHWRSAAQLAAPAYVESPRQLNAPRRAARLTRPPQLFKWGSMGRVSTGHHSCDARFPWVSSITVGEPTEMEEGNHQQLQVSRLCRFRGKNSILQILIAWVLIESFPIVCLITQFILKNIHSHYEFKALQQLWQNLKSGTIPQ